MSTPVIHKPAVEVASSSQPKEGLGKIGAYRWAICHACVAFSHLNF